MKTGVWEGMLVSLVLRDSVLGTGPEAYPEGKVAVKELQAPSGSILTKLEDQKLSDSMAAGWLQDAE